MREGAALVSYMESFHERRRLQRAQAERRMDTDRDSSELKTMSRLLCYGHPIG